MPPVLLSLLIGLLPVEEKQCREAYAQGKTERPETMLRAFSAHPVFGVLLQGAVIVDSDLEGGPEPSASFLLAIPQPSRSTFSLPLGLVKPWSGQVQVTLPSDFWCTRLAITREDPWQQALFEVPPNTSARVLVSHNGKTRVDVSIPIHQLGVVIFSRNTPLVLKPHHPLPQEVSSPGESVLLPVLTQEPADAVTSCVSLQVLAMHFAGIEDPRCREILAAARQQEEEKQKALEAEKEAAAAEAERRRSDAVRPTARKCTPLQDGKQLCLSHKPSVNHPGVVMLSTSGKLAEGSSVRLKVDGQLVGQGTGAPSLSVHWNGCQAPAGSRLLQAEALDASGRVTHAVQMTLKVEHPPRPPVLRASSAASGVLLDWDTCGSGAKTELYWSKTPEVGPDSHRLPSATSPFLHQLPAESWKRFYRVALRHGGQLLWSEVQQGAPAPTTCDAEGWCLTYPLPFPKASLRSLWGTGPGNLWAAGALGVHHWNGQRWVLTPAQGAMYGLSGSSTNDLWAVGDGGTAYYWDGNVWTPVALPPQASSLQDVWVAGPSEAWSVGAKGTLLRWDGATWSTHRSPVDKDLMAVWGSGPGDVWAVGDVGTVLHWDGKSWQRYATGTNRTLNTVWGTSAKDVWAAGDQGSLIHWDGRQWSPVDFPLETRIVQLSGRSATDVRVLTAGAGVLRWDGQKWTVLFTRVPEALVLLTNRIEYRNAHPDERWAFHAGVLGLEEKRWSSLLPQGDEFPLNDLATLPDGTAWAVGDAGTMLFWNGSAWEDHSLRMDMTTTAIMNYPLNLRAVWAVGPGQVWMTTTDGQLIQREGTSWREFKLEGQYTRAKELWGASPTAVWAASSDGVHFWNGSSWSRVLSTSGELSGISGAHAKDVWAVGTKGVAYHWDGATWTAIPTGEAYLRRISVKGQEVWGLGYGNTVVQWKGSEWRLNTPPVNAADTLNELTARGPKDVWLSTGWGWLFHWDGASWSLVSKTTPKGRSVMRAGGEKLWFTEEQQILFRQLGR